MKNNINKFITLTAILLYLPMLVFAEGMGVGNNVFSLGSRTIYSMPKDADVGQWSAGVQARLHLSLGLGLEASMDSRSNSFNNLTTIKTWPFQVSLLAYLFPGAVFSPYLLGGAGWYYTQVDGPFSFNHTDSRFGMHAGAGLEFMLNAIMSSSLHKGKVDLKPCSAWNKTFRLMISLPPKILSMSSET